MGMAILGLSQVVHSYCGIRGYSDKGVTCVWPYRDLPRKVHSYCGVQGYCDKGATWVHPSQDSPGKVHSYSGVLGYSNPGLFRIPYKSIVDAMSIVGITPHD